jgi:hypothetical protein
MQREAQTMKRSIFHESVAILKCVFQRTEDSSITGRSAPANIIVFCLLSSGPHQNSANHLPLYHFGHAMVQEIPGFSLRFRFQFAGDHVNPVSLRRYPRFVFSPFDMLKGYFPWYASCLMDRRDSGFLQLQFRVQIEPEHFQLSYFIQRSTA